MPFSFKSVPRQRIQFGTLPPPLTVVQRSQKKRRHQENTITQNVGLMQLPLFIAYNIQKERHNFVRDLHYGRSRWFADVKAAGVRAVERGFQAAEFRYQSAGTSPAGRAAHGPAADRTTVIVVHAGGRGCSVPTAQNRFGTCRHFRSRPSVRQPACRSCRCRHWFRPLHLPAVQRPTGLHSSPRRPRYVTVYFIK